LWEPYPAQPRYNTQYVGLRNRIGILVESYSYAPYKDRVLASRAFVRACLDHAAENRVALGKLLAAAKPRDTIPLRSRLAALPKPVSVLGYVEEQKDGKRVATGKPRTYEATYLGLSEPTLTVPRPYAYLVPASYRKAVEVLQRHGLALEELREDIEVD